MLKNYIITAFRNLIRNKTFSVINILGLALGIVSCLVILLYVQKEFSFDRFNKNYENTYRVASNIYVPGKNVSIGAVSSKLGPSLKANFPEVKNYVRLFDIGRYMRQVVRYQDKTYYTQKFMYADSSFFSVFSYHLLEGNPSNVLSAPFSIILTKSESIQYFGNQDPIGKMIQVVQADSSVNFTVTGIVADPPPNSSLQFDFLASFSTLYTNWWTQNWTNIDKWGEIDFYTYILLNDHHSIKSLEVKLQPFMAKVLKEATNEKGGLRMSIFFQPLKDIHLFSHLDLDLPSTENAQPLYVLSAIAFFLLLIACVNFMNLSTAKHIKRAKEISVRKVLGAKRIQLVRQFLIESVIISIIAAVIALVLIEISLPYTKTLTGTRLSLNQLNITVVILAILGIAGFTGLLAGIYPALFLSSFNPVAILKQTSKSANFGNIIRKFLVVFQFTISIALIVSALVIQKQLSYVQNSSLGFNKNNLVVIRLNNQLNSDNTISRTNSFRTEIERNPGIIKTTVASEYPGYMLMHTGFDATGKNAEHTMINTVYVDSNYVETLGIKMKRGTSFSLSHTQNPILINESSVKKFGFDNPIGQYLQTGWGVKAEIIGVIKDFNFESLHNTVNPLVLAERPDMINFLICRISERNIPSTLKFLRDKWQIFYPGIPFDYSFLDSDLGMLYVKDQRLGSTVNIFTTLAIIIACLGLFGLASFSVEERTKEIGIRRVLGAPVVDIVELLSKDFIKLVLLANLIAWPIAYFLMSNWLQNFSYRVNVSWWIFVLAGGIALVIALLTVGVQSIKAATANPVKSLKYE